jgi:hypothetical protein
MRGSHLTGLTAGALLLCAAGVGGTGEETAPAAVTLQVVKYGELGKLVRSHHGKVVVLDFWSTT